MSDFEKLYLVIAACQAFLTVLVVIAAVAGDWVRYLVFGDPMLVAALKHPKVRREQNRETHEILYWFHLRISNTHKWIQANNVSIIIKGIQRSTVDNQFIDEPQSGPLQLQRQYGAIYGSQSRNVGADQIYDFGYLAHGSNFKLTPINGFSGITNCELSANETMRVLLQVEADNAEPVEVSFEIVWDGQWSDDENEMSKHLFATPIVLQ